MERPKRIEGEGLAIYYHNREVELRTKVIDECIEALPKVMESSENLVALLNHNSVVKEAKENLEKLK